MSHRNQHLLQFAAMLCLVVCATGCQFIASFHGIPGSGVSAQEDRIIEDFNQLVFSGAGTLQIVASGEPSCTIECDDNLLDYMVTEVTDGTLHIYPSESLRPKAGLTVTVSCSDLDSIAVTGSCDVELSELDAESFTLSVSGACDARLAGSAKELTINLSGAGKVNALALDAMDAKVRVSGSGDVSVHARESLDVSISGAAHVVYQGTATLSKSISGIGSVTKLQDDTL